MQNCGTAKYNLSYFFYQYRNLPTTFIFSFLSINIYKMATIAKWQSLNHAVYLYVCTKLNIYSHS